MVAKLKREYGSGIEPLTHLGQNYMVVDRSLIPEILQILRDEEQFDYCVDITAVHYPKREKQFDVVWMLYSFPRNERIRVKTQIADGESLPSSVPIWATAQLAGARSVRHVRDQVRRASGSEAHSAAGWMEGTSVAQGLRHSAAGQGVGADQFGDRERAMRREALTTEDLGLDSDRPNHK